MKHFFIAFLLAVVLMMSYESHAGTCVPVRDSHGKIKRSSYQLSKFKKLHPCPSTGKSTGACPGWVVDHIDSLACCGADRPENMQWQTVADAKAKDKWERVQCVGIL